MEHSMTQSALEAAVMMHPLDSADALTIDRIRAAVRGQKGARWSIEARKPYDALLDSVPAPDDVTFKPATVGDVSGVWVYPASSRPDQAILHFRGGWFHAGSATAYRHLVGHIAARAATRALSRRGSETSLRSCSTMPALPARYSRGNCADADRTGSAVQQGHGADAAMVRPRRLQRRHGWPGTGVRPRAHEAPRLGTPPRATRWALKTRVAA
jgi:hypothetical protein